MEKMQILDRVKNCNGCSACIVGCKEMAIKMQEDEEGRKYPVINEDACSKCNNCVLYCPIFNPVELPEFTDFYKYDEEYYKRPMPEVYRETMRTLKKGEAVHFVGTLCQIAGLKSLMGDRLDHNLKLYPLYCDMDNPKRPECAVCPFWEKYRK